jgi:hypothetical protein
MTQEIASQTGFYVGTFLGVFMVGAICGLLPLIAGLCQRNRGLAGGSWAFCVFVGLLGWIVTSTPEVSLCISLPVAFVLMVLILCHTPGRSWSSLVFPLAGGIVFIGTLAAMIALWGLPSWLAGIGSGLTDSGFPGEVKYGQYTPSHGTEWLDQFDHYRELPDKTKGSWIETRRYKYQVHELRTKYSGILLPDGQFKEYQSPAIQYAVALYRKRFLRSDKYIGWMGPGSKSYHEMSVDIPRYMTDEEVAETIRVHERAAGNMAIIKIPDLSTQSNRDQVILKVDGPPAIQVQGFTKGQNGKMMLFTDKGTLHEGGYLNGFKVVTLSETSATLQKDGQVWTYIYTLD